MRSRLQKTLRSLALGALCVASGCRAASADLVDRADAPQAPAFTHTAPADWLNSPPLDWAQLRGKVVLIDVWTFACWNCYRSLPWVNGLEAQFDAARFTVLGVHTPELPQEYLRDKVVAKVAEFGVRAPVMIDNDYSYWNALHNHYWPAFYLVDAQGRIRARYTGETHAGDAQARRIEHDIRSLLEQG